MKSSQMTHPPKGFHAGLLSLFFFPIALGLLAARPIEVSAAFKAPTVLLVDKKQNELYVTYYRENKYEVIKKYRTTVGMVTGDKEVEADLKTPEGVYFFTSRLTPPNLKSKFGAMAFYMNYPNTFDKLAGSTGYDIMLHSTNEPSRLQFDLDSEGCIVLTDKEIKEVQEYVRINLTPILVFDEIQSDYWHPESDGKLKKFFADWIAAWTGKNIDGYISKYHSAFTANGRNLNQYRVYKNELNKNYEQINVSPEKVMYYRHPKYSVISFIQNYSSTLKNGAKGHQSRGTKMLLVGEEKGEFKIIEEDFTDSTW